MKFTVGMGEREWTCEVDEKEGFLRVHDGQEWRKVRLDEYRRSIRVASIDNRKVGFGWRQADDTYEVVIDGVPYAVRVRDGRYEHLRKVQRGAAAQASVTLIRAPIPGLVVKVNVKPGDTVLKGQCLLVLAAMKLENEISAPRDGKITAVDAQTGGAVEKGTPLVTLG